MRRPLTKELAAIKFVSQGEGHYVSIAQPALVVRRCHKSRYTMTRKMGEERICFRPWSSRRPPIYGLQKKKLCD